MLSSSYRTYEEWKLLVARDGIELSDQFLPYL